ncbi:DUF2914 domain-containing protein [Patescibacteria group bacterium]|nr:DUF2914 domain-containing protein [Patescibacteria group bacterium]
MGDKFKNLKSWIEKNDKYLSIAFFTGGFVLDNFTLTRIDLLFDNLVLFSYLTLATLAILLINLIQAGKLNKIETRFPAIVNGLSLVTQFTFGGLFSGYVIFYTKSASLASSWIFMLIIYGFFIGNEKFRKHYKRVDFQLSILFLAVFSFMIFFLPVIFKKVETYIFILAGLISLTFIFFFYQFLLKFVFSNRIKRSQKSNLAKYIITIYLAFNLMYFFNIIPPVPLSLTEVGIYQGVVKSSEGEYLLNEYDFPWYQFGNYFMKVNGGTVYVYSSVFAPADLDTNIINVWQRYNEETHHWVVVEKIGYPIKGGRGEGYRGYSFITNATKGKWRVDVTNARGQVLGRVKFEVE